MSLKIGEILIWKERGSGEIQIRGGQADQQTDMFKVRLGLGEIGRIDREIELTIKIPSKAGEPN